MSISWRELNESRMLSARRARASALALKNKAIENNLQEKELALAVQQGAVK